MTAPHNLTKAIATKRQYDKGSRNNFESNIWRYQRTCGVYSVKFSYRDAEQFLSRV